MKKILITRKLIKESEDKASKTFNPTFNNNDELYSQSKIIEMSKGYDGILSSLTEKLDKQTIEKFCNSLPKNIIKVGDSQVSNRWGNILDFQKFDIFNYLFSESKSKDIEFTQYLRPVLSFGPISLAISSGTPNLMSSCI